MTEFEKQCYGMSSEVIRREYLNSFTGRFSGVPMVVASILSDCQEMLEMGYDKDLIRKQLNIAKFCLFDEEKSERKAA